MRWHFVGRLKAWPRAIALRYGCEPRKHSGLTQTPYNFHSLFPDVWKDDIGGHARAQFVVVIRQTNFYTVNLADSVFDGLHIAGRKFGLTINLLNGAVEILPRKRIYADENWISHFD